MVQWIAGDDADAKAAVADEEYRQADAAAVVAAVWAGQPIPPTPAY